MARLAARFDVAIMADEALGTIFDAMNLVQHNAADVFALKLTKAGGPLATMKVAAIAEAAAIPCYGGCMLETSVGTAAYLHTFAAIGAIRLGCELFGPLLLEDLSYPAAQLPLTARFICTRATATVSSSTPTSWRFFAATGIRK